ncbi:MAG: DUF1080 domain-containing protein [Pirellulales bacterium]
MNIRWTSLAILLTWGAAIAAGETTAPARLTATLNAPPPAGAIVLYDGSSMDAWASQKYRKWEDTDGPADWKILANGSLEVVPGAGSLITKERFGDCKLHLELRLLGPPTNGGVFVMCRYELGIKSDAVGERPYVGAFENLKEPIRPLVHTTLPVRHWQSLDADFRAPRLNEKGATTEHARASVWLNGVLIHDNVELGPRKGAAKRLGDATAAPLMLQEHGAAYQFRNIWIVDQSAKSR